MLESEEVGNAINAILLQQGDILSYILTEQRLIRESATQRNWERLEASIYKVQVLSEQFNELETKRLEYVAVMSSDSTQDLYQIANLFPVELRQSILDNFRKMKQKLSVSKIENDSLTDYIKITRDFLQGVFDTVVPQRRNVLYSKAGKIVKSLPESMVLDQLL